MRPEAVAMLIGASAFVAIPFVVLALVEALDQSSLKRDGHSRHTAKTITPFSDATKPARRPHLRLVRKEPAQDPCESN
jgi:hypothetical protein